MSQLKRLAGQTAVYGISSILGKSINFALIPIYTAYLPKEDVGAFTHIFAFIAFFNILFTFGMETAYFRFSTGKGLNPHRVYSNVQSLILTTSLSMGALIYLSATPISEFLDYQGQAHLFRYVALLLTIDAILAIPFAKLRAENQALKFAMLKVANILLNVGFNILFIVVFFHIFNGDILTFLQPFLSSWYEPDRGIDYILISQVLANGLILPLLFYYSGKFKYTLDKTILQPMWHYAVPLLFMGLAGVTNEVFSRALFEHALPEDFYPDLTSREAGGVFGANFKLAILMNLIIQAFKYAAEPFFFQQADNKNNPAIFAKVMHWFVIFCSLLMIAVAVNLNIIGPLILRGEGYEQGLIIVPLLLLGYLFLGIYFNLSIWFKITDRTKYSFYITAIGAVITVVVVLTMVPILGFMGAALSTILSYMTMSIICYVIGQKYYPIPYQTGKAIFYLTVATAFSYAGFLLGLDNAIINFLFQNLFVVAFVIIIYLMEKEELISIIKTFKK
jgi:O-antigen/teichoic acid export membrane protein